MNYENALFIAAVFCVLFSVVFSMMIVHELRKRNYKINFFLLRLMIIKYVNDYKKITIAEQGYPGYLYRLYLLSLQLTLLFVIMGIIVKYY